MVPEGSEVKEVCVVSLWLRNYWKEWKINKTCILGLLLRCIFFASVWTVDTAPGFLIAVFNQHFLNDTHAHTHIYKNNINSHSNIHKMI